MSNNNYEVAAQQFMAKGNPDATRFPLTDKQQEFFKRRRIAMQQIEMEMRGALQMIVEENDIRGKCTLSEDFTALVIEPEGNQEFQRTN
jgi:hypothetical protein